MKSELHLETVMIVGKLFTANHNIHKDSYQWKPLKIMTRCAHKNVGYGFVIKTAAVKMKRMR